MRYDVFSETHVQIGLLHSVFIDCIPKEGTMVVTATIWYETTLLVYYYTSWDKTGSSLHTLLETITLYFNITQLFLIDTV